MRIKVQLNFRNAYRIEFTSLLSQNILRSVEVIIHSFRHDNSVQVASKDYELIVDSDENNRRFELLHANVRKYKTDPNRLVVATGIEGCIKCKAWVF